MTWTTTIGCTAALAMIAIAASTPWDGSGYAQTVFRTNAATHSTSTLPTHISASSNILAQLAAEPEAPAPTASQSSGSKAGTEMDNMGMGMGMTGPADQSKPNSLRETIEQKMLEPATFKIADTTISTLAKELRQATGLPVISDPRGVALAGEGQATPSFSYEADGLPLQVALREMLRPAALRAEVRDDSLVITADTAELARRGIGTSRWINVDKAAGERIEKALASETSQQFIEEPLESAVSLLSEQLDLPITIDLEALEAIGLSTDTAVSVNVRNVQARTLLEAILGPLELTYTIQRERLVITSAEAADSNRLLRIYWLDGLGSWEHDFDSLMMAVQSSINPDTWEALGGPSTMTPLVGSKVQRPGLLVSTTLSVHQQIETLLNVMRETYLGPDYLDPPPFLKQQPTVHGSGMGGFGGGMGGGGMGGGGGGGGGGMF